MIRIADIQRAVAHNFRIPEEKFRSRCRDRRVARPRQIAMMLARELTPHSLPSLGSLFDRDHTTIIHGIAAARRLIAADQHLALKVASIRWVLIANQELSQFQRILARLDDPSARKTLIMSRWERGELSIAQAKHLIRAGGLEAA